MFIPCAETTHSNTNKRQATILFNTNYVLWYELYLPYTHTNPYIEVLILSPSQGDLEIVFEV